MPPLLHDYTTRLWVAHGGAAELPKQVASRSASSGRYICRIIRCPRPQPLFRVNKHVISPPGVVGSDDARCRCGLGAPAAPRVRYVVVFEGPCAAWVLCVRACLGFFCFLFDEEGGSPQNESGGSRV